MKLLIKFHIENYKLKLKQKLKLKNFKIIPTISIEVSTWFLNCNNVRGSSDSESISESEFETTSEWHKESIRGCYNNEFRYSQEEIDKMKKKRMAVFLKRKVPKKMILGWVMQHGLPVGTASFMTIWTQSPADAVKKMLFY